MNSNYEFCLIGSYTDVGRVRKANEDYMDCFDTPNGKAVVVCDGMGGHVGGQIASQTAVTAIHDFLINKVFPDPREAIYHAITAANTAILNSTQAQPELSGMGSTCVMLIITPDGKVYYGHVGDSRIYIVANRKIRQLTTDHSYVQMLVDAGQITKEQAEHHPRKNEITNALGIPNMQPPTVCSEPIEPEAGNCFLLCSDGLTGMVDDTHIERVVSNRTLKIQQRAEKLVQMANEAGGVDNITVQLVEFALSARDISGSKKEGKKSLKKLLLFIIPAVLILGGAAVWCYLKKPQPNLNDGNTDKIEIQNTAKEPENPVNFQPFFPVTYLTNPVDFTKVGSPTIAEILDYNDSILEISENKNVKIEKIEGKYITIKWLREIKEDTVKISCKTKQAENCTIKIPVKIPRLTGNDKPVSFTTDTVTVKKGESLIGVPLKEYKGKLGKSKELNADADTTKMIKHAETNPKGDEILIDLKKGVEIPTKITFTLKGLTVDGQDCKITIPVKVKEETPVPDKNTGENGVII